MARLYVLACAAALCFVLHERGMVRQGEIKILAGDSSRFVLVLCVSSSVTHHAPV